MNRFLNPYFPEQNKSDFLDALNSLGGQAFSDGADYEHDHDLTLDTVRFNEDTQVLQYWDGTQWVDVPAIEGTLRYNEDDDTIERFDGTNWLVIFGPLNGTIRIDPDTDIIQEWETASFTWITKEFQTVDPGGGAVWLSDT